MIVTLNDALALTGYPLARLRRWVQRQRVRARKLHAGRWEFDAASLRLYLREIKRLESAPNFRQAIGRKGGHTRAQAFTRAYQQAARACVRHESNVANGRLGGKAYVRKYGKRSLVERARQYRLAHPSNLEKIVRRALHRIRVHDFEREGYIFPRSHVHLIMGDFVFRRAHAVVYADGDTWHQNLPSLVRCAERGTRDQHYDNYLRYRGWHILRLSEDEILQYARAAKQEPHSKDLPLLQKLRTFLTECGAMDRPRISPDRRRAAGRAQRRTHEVRRRAT